jgi:hypothetical protein
MIEGETVMEADLKEAFENCLLCRACTANCFPAVKTDQLVVAFRESYAQRFGRSTIQRWIFRNFLPYPDRMARIIGLAWLSKRAGMADLARKMGIVGMINPKLVTAMELRDEVPSSFLRGRTKGKDLTAKAESKYKVGYWVSCGYNYMLPEVGEATINVLRHNWRGRPGAWQQLLRSAGLRLRRRRRRPQSGQEEHRRAGRSGSVRLHCLRVWQLLGPSEGVRRAAGR